MESKKVRKVLITGIATVAGLFGGFKIYSNKKKKVMKSIAQEETAKSE